VQVRPAIGTSTQVMGALFAGAVGTSVICAVGYGAVVILRRKVGMLEYNINRQSSWASLFSEDGEVSSLSPSMEMRIRMLDDVPV